MVRPFFAHFLSFFLSFFFFCGSAACGILVPQTGIEPAPPALEAQSLNHWTTLAHFLLRSYSLVYGFCFQPFP